VQISDEHVDLLRAYLNQDLENVLRRNDLVRGRGDFHGYSELIAAAFIIAARRHFSPSWSRADVIRYVAGVRKHEISHEDFDPLTAEAAILGALGIKDDTEFDAEQWTRSQIFLLEALVLDAELQARDIDDLLTEARALAPSLFAP
jgi:hypothetical protein